MAGHGDCKNENEGKVYTYDEAMDLTGHGRYNILMLITCCIIINAVALDMFGFSVIVAVSNCDLKLGLTETGMLASAPFAGVIFAYPWGYYADTRGRRRAILISTLIGFVFAAVSSMSPSWQLMMLFKVIASSFSSASFSLTMTILGESTSSKYRSKYLFIMNSANLLSECVSFGLAYFILPLQFSVPIRFLGFNYRPWRLFTLLLALPLGVGGLMMAYLHESPKFLASRGDNKKALEVMKSIYERNGGQKGEYLVQHLLNTDDVEAIPKISFWESVVQQTVPIFKPPLLWRSLQLFYLMAICCSTNNAFAMWFPIIVNIFFKSFTDDADGGWNTDKTFCTRVFANNNTAMTHGASINEDYECNDTISSYTILFGILYGVFFSVVTLIVSKVASHRRLVLLAWLVVSCVSGCLVDLRQPAASLIFFVLQQTTIVAVPSVADYCGELYPTAYRGMVTSLSIMAGRMISLAGVNVVGAVIATNCSLTFYAWSGFVFSGIVVSLFLPSDKKVNKNRL